MKRTWKIVGCWALLCGVFGAASLPAQDARHTRIGADPSEVALNDLLTSAQAAMSANDYPTAAQKYQEYLAQKPDDAVVHFNLGYAYTAMKKPVDAIPEYQKAISLDPKLFPAYRNLGVTLLASDPAAAVEPLQKATELVPEEADVKYLLGVALERSGKSDGATEQYRAAEKLDDKNADVHLALGRTLLAANHPGDAETEFRTASTLRPQDTAAQLGIARALVSQQKNDQAAQQYDTYLAKQPQDFTARTQYASLLFALGKYPETLSQLDINAATHPEGVDALRVRSQAYSKMKRYDDSIQTLQKASALAPQDMTVLFLLGQAYLAKKDYPNAIRSFAPVAQANPNANDVVENLVMAQYGNGNYQAALNGIDLLSHRVELAPNALFVRASCYDKMEDKIHALDAYKKFLDVNKDQNNDMYFEASVRVRVLTRELENKR